MIAPGHDDAPYIQINWSVSPRVRRIIEVLKILAVKLRKVLMALLLFGFTITVVHFRTQLEHAVVSSVNRAGKSADLQARPSLWQTSNQVVPPDK